MLPVRCYARSDTTPPVGILNQKTPLEMPDEGGDAFGETGVLDTKTGEETWALGSSSPNISYNE